MVALKREPGEVNKFFGCELGAQTMLGLVPAVWPRWISRLNLRAEPVGPIMEIDAVKVQVAMMNLDPRLH